MPEPHLPPETLFGSKALITNPESLTPEKFNPKTFWVRELPEKMDHLFSNLKNNKRLLKSLIPLAAITVITATSVVAKFESFTNNLPNFPKTKAEGRIGDKTIEITPAPIFKATATSEIGKERLPSQIYAIMPTSSRPFLDEIPEALRFTREVDKNSKITALEVVATMKAETDGIWLEEKGPFQITNIAWEQAEKNPRIKAFLGLSIDKKLNRKDPRTQVIVAIQILDRSKKLGGTDVEIITRYSMGETAVKNNVPPDKNQNVYVKRRLDAEAKLSNFF